MNDALLLKQTMLKVMFAYPEQIEDSFEVLDEIESIGIPLVDIDMQTGAGPDSIKEREEWFKNNKNKDWFVIYEWWQNGWFVTDIVMLLSRGLGIEKGIKILLDRLKLKMRSFKYIEALYLIYGYNK